MTDDMKNVLTEALKDATGGAASADADKVSAVSNIAIQLLTAQSELEALNKKVEEKTAEIKQLEERDLPAAMADLGMKNFEMLDGSKITTETVYLANIKVDNRNDAFKWLRETANESLIKAEVQIPFAKGDVESAALLIGAINTMLTRRRKRLEQQLAEAQAAGDAGLASKLLDEISAYNVEPGLDQSVHWATLRAFVKEQITREEEALEAKELDPEKDKDKLFPRELFGVYIFDRAKVVPKKEKKK